ncbi:hypothetical protein MLD38_005560 [Melastoma candidum]|uniref:Uncharacterized protein n=1 Tax=Melastoma candidum TaxID=119954 RepID=A0ACB9RTH5_9MYRT|nr:hypothetical protein MLD38_005560 [Melastoma candidum]
MEMQTESRRVGKISYRSLRQLRPWESSSASSSFLQSTENANGVFSAGIDASARRGRFSADVWLEPCGEKGGEGVGESEKSYFWLPGPTLTGRGEGGVGGEEVGVKRPSSSSFSSMGHLAFLPDNLSVQGLQRVKAEQLAFMGSCSLLFFSLNLSLPTDPNPSKP